MGVGRLHAPFRADAPDGENPLLKRRSLRWQAPTRQERTRARCALAQWPAGADPSSPRPPRAGAPPIRALHPPAPGLTAGAAMPERLASSKASAPSHRGMCSMGAWSRAGTLTRCALQHASPFVMALTGGERCWVAQGDRQWLELDLPAASVLERVAVQFQGGFSAQVRDCCPRWARSEVESLILRAGHRGAGRGRGRRVARGGRLRRRRLQRRADTWPRLAGGASEGAATPLSHSHGHDALPLPPASTFSNWTSRCGASACASSLGSWWISTGA